MPKKNNKMKSKVINSQPSTFQIIDENTPLLWENKLLVKQINNSQNKKTIDDFFNETMIEIISMKCTIS